ncbi:hypothetical protein CH365_17195 [Leptospira neocaledonica]|uniref:WG repeat-containing protein n=1 Tax=Leptospira neocaledonica TaxID=2023192 RepID=A0A2M9ZUY5_9LEPT|nr:hypothetical protein CH365_17195 [Leptospira neocaledonica]
MPNLSQIPAVFHSLRFKIFSGLILLSITLGIYYIFFLNTTSNHSCTTNFEYAAGSESDISFVVLKSSNRKIPDIKLIGDFLDFLYINSRPNKNYLTYYRKSAYGLLGGDGQVILLPNYLRDIYVIPGKAVVASNSKNPPIDYHIFDLNGRQISDQGFRRISHTEINSPDLIIVSVEDLEGVYNLKERKFQIPPTYDEIRSAEEGLFIVRKDRKTFYINENNESVFPLTFNSARNFSEGLATVGRDDKYAYIDRKGNLITDFIFEAAGDFHEGLALVCLNGKYGYIDRKGNLQIPAQFDREDYFYNGRTVVLQNGKKYLIDTSGEKISSGYDNIDKYNEFLILAFKNNSAPVALLDWNGKNILHTNISYVRNQADGNIIVETEKRNPNFILNAKGEILFTTKNPLHQVQYDNGYFISKIPEYPDQEPDNSSNKNYLINIKDKSQKTIPAGEIEYFREGIFLVHENDKKYYMNVLLEKIPATSSIKTFSQFNNGLASVEIDQKYGMIDKSGAFVIPPIFDKIGENIDGKYIVVKDKQSGLLDLESCLR